MTKRGIAALLVPGLLLMGSADRTRAASPTRELVALRATEAPTIDGVGDDPCWALAVPLVTHDPMAKIDIELRAVYAADQVFIRARFPDPSESRDYQVLHWNPVSNKYDGGPEREDTLVLKWSMEPVPVDLTLRSDDAYQADIWYWKANRTDPVGYADDKVQIYSEEHSPEAKRLISRSGRGFFLTRKGDDGEAAYEALVYTERQGERVPRYLNRKPTGSRADIRAKGGWRGGTWTVEFARRLDTGHLDDVAFAVPGRYQFGVSRFEIAGREPDPSLEEPLFGSGDVAEELWLILP